MPPKSYETMVVLQNQIFKMDYLVEKKGNTIQKAIIQSVTADWAYVRRGG